MLLLSAQFVGLDFYSVVVNLERSCFRIPLVQRILWPRYNSLSYGGTAYFPITSGARPRPRRASSSRHQEASRCWA